MSMNQVIICILICGICGIVFSIEVSNVTNNSSSSAEMETQNRTSQNYKPGNKAYEKCKEYGKSICNSTPSELLQSLQSRVNIHVHNGVLVFLRSEYPYMTAIGFNNENGKIMWLCGGSLISERFVLTAAHCCFSSTWGNATIARLGDLNLRSDDDDESAKSYVIIERIKHPNYTFKSYYHDIALLKLEKEVEFSLDVRPICLWHPDRELKDISAVAAGWGRRNWDEVNTTGILLKVSLTLSNNSYCNRIYSDEVEKLNRGIVSEWQICAGGDSKDTCQGDSGSPLFICDIQSGCLCTALGVTSVGKICEGVVPGVYTRVSHYVSWIEEIVWP